MYAKDYKHWLYAAIAAYIFVYLIPWTDILGREFEDTFNYLRRIVYLKRGGEEIVYVGISWFFSEPLWKQIVLFIGITATDYREALYVISFISLFLYGSFLFRRVEFYIGMLFLLNTFSVNLYIEQVRMALAFSMVLVAYDLDSKRWGIFFVFMAFLIHASVPIFIGSYYLLYRLNQKIESKKYYIVAIGLALFMALFMKFGANILLTAVGDRHAGYGNVIAGSSIAYSMVWFMLAFVLATFASFETEKERILIAYAIVFMSFFFFSSVLGMYAQRYVAVTIPIIIVAIGYLPKHVKQITYMGLFAYNLLMLKYWLQFSLV